MPAFRKTDHLQYRTKEDLQQQLDAALRVEDYERAAQLRDVLLGKVGDVTKDGTPPRKDTWGPAMEYQRWPDSKAVSPVPHSPGSSAHELRIEALREKLIAYKEEIRSAVEMALVKKLGALPDRYEYGRHLLPVLLVPANYVEFSWKNQKLVTVQFRGNGTPVITMHV